MFILRNKVSVLLGAQCCHMTSQFRTRDGTLKQVTVLLWTPVAQDIFQHCSCKGLKCFWGELQNSQLKQSGGNTLELLRKGRSSNKNLCNSLALEKLLIQILNLSCISKSSWATARKPVPSLGSWNWVWSWNTKFEYFLILESKKAVGIPLAALKNGCLCFLYCIIDLKASLSVIPQDK